MKIFVNERIVDEEKAVISVFDRGLLYGDGVFETMRSYKGRIPTIDKHLDRLHNSAEIIGLKINMSKKYLKFIIYKLIKVNRLKDAYIRLAVTRGKGRIGLDATSVKDQGVVIIIKKFKPYPDALYKKGISLFTSSVRRNEKSDLCKAKTLNYLNNILARMEVQQKGATDALLLNTEGGVAESAVSNIFMVKGKKLITPSIDSGALPGITREMVLSLADKLNLKPVEKHVKPAELKKADEVFVTNTLMGAMPVVKIDDKKIGKGKPGAVTKSICRLYHDKMSSKESA